jgi:hypothetical protein
MNANGYEVFSTTKSLEAAAQIQAGNLCALLICYSLSERWKSAPSNSFEKVAQMDASWA